MKKRIAAGVVGTICVLGLAYVPASPAESGFADNHMHFRGAQLTALQDAANYAAWCGGEVIVDRDDKEILVSSCDK